MNIEVQLPDGSIAEFPQGTPPEIMQAEIEKVLGGSPANPSRNPDPTGERPNLRVPNRLIQGQRGGGNADMPPSRSMSAFPEQQAPDQAPQVIDGTTRRVDRYDDPLGMTAPQEAFEKQSQRVRAREQAQANQEAARDRSTPYQPPTMGASELNTPAVRNATEQSAPSRSAIQTADERYAPAPPSGSSGRARQRPDSPPMDGALPQSGLPAGSAARRETQPQPVPDEQVDQAISKYQELTERLLDPNLDNEMRRALETQQSALRLALESSESTSDWARTRIAQAGNLLGAATDAVGQGAARALSIFSPELGAAIDRQSQGGGTQNDPQLTGPANSMERAAQDSALEAARLRAEQGITSARGSMGDNITQGNQEAAAEQADAARAEVAGNDAPRERPATAAGQGAAVPELQFPQSLSTRDARPGQTAQNPETMTFSMGDGSAVQIRTMPQRARDNAVRSGMDFQQQQANRLIRSLIERGDISKAMEFRTFMNEQQTQRGMTEMNRTVAAASYGDSSAFTTAFDRMVRSFDPDGPWQVNTEDTKLIEQDGQAVGAILSLKNKDTGEVMNQEYLGMQEVIGGISRWGSLESQFEYQKERVTAAASQRIANAESYQNAYDEAMKAMFPADSWVDYEKNYIGEEEQQRRHQAVVDRIQQVRPDLVPQGAASGVGAGGFTGGSNGQPVPTLGG